MNLFEEQAKFVFVGDVGAGKTTAITTLSDGPIMSMDVPLSEDIPIDGKLTTTVGFDFTVLRVGDTPLFLYGTPGQDRFRFVADNLISGAIGAVLLINAAAPDPLQTARQWLDMLAASGRPLQVVIALNRIRPDGPSLAEFRQQQDRGALKVLAVQSADPRSRSEMLTCLRLLTLRVMDQMALPMDD